MGWTFPWSVTAVRGTHYCLRKIDYPEIWRLLKEEGITHMNAAPTVNTLLCNDPGAERLDIPVRVTVAASPPSAHLFKTMENLNLQPVHVSRKLLSLIVLEAAVERSGCIIKQGGCVCYL